MVFTLIICTYKRRYALQNLLDSVKLQTLYPNEILIIDGSPDDQTKVFLQNTNYDNLIYYKVSEQDRGLTKQRNFGINKVSDQSEIVCFLDDDIVLTNTYFEEILLTYSMYPLAIGVSGYIINNGAKWKKLEKNQIPTKNKFYFDGWERELSKRYLLRKKIGLWDNFPPGIMPNYSHGKAVSFFPPSNKIYTTDFFSGGIASYRKKALDENKFSEYFIGYGLYEDVDFTIRLSKKGKLFVNTKALLYHYHDASGRPNMFLYGKMVVRNGWYVWKVGVEHPGLSGVIKWHLTELFLLILLFLGIFKSNNKKNILNESSGRLIAWFSLFFNAPKINRNEF